MRARRFIDRGFECIVKLNLVILSKLFISITI